MKKISVLLTAISKDSLFLRKPIRKATQLYRITRYKLRGLGRGIDDKLVVFSCFSGKKYADLYGGHEWSGDSCKAVCKLCGMKKPGGKHRWTGNTCVDRCKLCGEKNPEGKHQWTGDTCVDYCTLCGAKYPDHKYEMVASRTTSYGTKIGTYRCAGCGREYEQPYEWSSSDSV